MSATEELRRLLDEHGVEWGVPEEWCGVLGDGIKSYVTTVGNMTVWCCDDRVSVYGLTVGQVVNVIAPDDTCHIVDEWGEGWWECDKCGCAITCDDPHDHPCCNYCPNCGRRVVEL